MREIRSSGSVEGVISDGHSYSDSVGINVSAAGAAHAIASVWRQVFRRYNFGRERRRPVPLDVSGRRVSLAAW
jgi:hypothetical protein